MNDHSTTELFGDHKEQPIIKQKGNNYKPNFNEVAPEQRRFIEVYGEDKPSNFEALRNEKLQQKKIAVETELDTYDKKMSSIFYYIFFSFYLFCK